MLAQANARACSAAVTAVFAGAQTTPWLANIDMPTPFVVVPASRTCFAAVLCRSARSRTCEVSTRSSPDKVISSCLSSRWPRFARCFSEELYQRVQALVCTKVCGDWRCRSGRGDRRCHQAAVPGGGDIRAQITQFAEISRSGLLGENACRSVVPGWSAARNECLPGNETYDEANRQIATYQQLLYST